MAKETETAEADPNVHKLPGRVRNNDDGRIIQEDYGEWPECEMCKQQVEPALFSMHTNEHYAALRGGK